MPSSSTATTLPWSRCPPSPATSGRSASATTGSVSNPTTPSRYSPSSSACTTRPSTRAPGSAWRCPRRSWSSTGDASGSATARARAPPSASPCRWTRSRRPPRKRAMMTLAESDPVRPIEVLLVEDDEGDVLMTREALEEGKVINRLSVVGDGVEAVEYLRRDGKYAEASRPDLILLDLNLPKKDGRQVLEEVKADDSLRRIPVIVLTTSAADEDVLRSYDLHANAYVTKPVDFDRFVEVIRQIDDFFISVVRLPPA